MMAVTLLLKHLGGRPEAAAAMLGALDRLIADAHPSPQPEDERVSR